MEITKEYLEQKIAEFQANADQLMRDSVANKGAADGLRMLLADLGKPESKPPETTGSPG